MGNLEEEYMLHDCGYFDLTEELCFFVQDKSKGEDFKCGQIERDNLTL
jgi:hypothetical protein